MRTEGAHTEEGMRADSRARREWEAQVPSTVSHWDSGEAPLVLAQ